ncbi:MAG: MCE family protein [Jatrophihabitans sp.]|uniref:MCE family protein n=1 Tax=Jatrophihabitans sp. TaxID=1932789 RepID=UPI003F7EDE9D
MRRSLLPVLASGALLLSGCGLTLEDLPAPDALNGAAAYTVTAQFTDVQNLTVGAKVKLAGVVVGEVSSISTHDFVADVRLRVEQRFPLAADAQFQIRFTTPLGEDFVAVTSTLRPGAPRLAAGTTVRVAQTSAAPSIEDTFAAVSTLLNGGGLDQIHVIATELQQTLHGRNGAVRDIIGQLDTVLATLDDHKGDIDRTLVSLRDLAGQLDRDDTTITQALQQFPDALRTLADNTAGLTRLLQKVQGLGVTVRGLLDRSTGDMIATLDNLQPTLDSLRAADATLVPTFRTLIRFGQLFDHAAPGDYVNLYGTIVGLLQSPGYQPQAGGEAHAEAGAPVTAPDATSSVSVLLGGGRR